MEIYSHFLQYFINLQYTLNSYIASTIRSLNNGDSLTTSLLIIGIAFIYGVVHAAGPGHGKTLVAFYFTSNKGSYKEAFKIGYLISIIHAISGLSVTFAIFFTLRAMFREKFDNISELTMQISSVMIMMIGIYLIYEAYKNRKAKEDIQIDRNKSEYAVALGAGIVPCPGVMSIVLFSILLKHYLLGVLAAIAMSIGMGLTISIAGILSIAVNKKAGSFLDKKGYILEMLGAVLIFILGLFLWFASNTHITQHKII
jgi:nickel/cobalt exporter